MKHLLIILSTFLIFSLNVNAQASITMMSELKAELEFVSPSDCGPALTKVFDLEASNFFIFLENTFQNKSSNSSLLAIAATRYREYKENILEASKLISPASAEYMSSKTDIMNNLLLCEDLTNAYITLGKDAMIKHIRSNHSQKQATILVEKYRSINDQLRELNFSIMKTYAYFLTFKNKLPFFTENCVTN